MDCVRKRCLNGSFCHLSLCKNVRHRQSKEICGPSLTDWCGLLGVHTAWVWGHGSPTGSTGRAAGPSFGALPHSLGPIAGDDEDGAESDARLVMEQLRTASAALETSEVALVIDGLALQTAIEEELHVGMDQLGEFRPGPHSPFKRQCLTPLL